MTFDLHRRPTGVILLLAVLCTLPLIAQFVGTVRGAIATPFELEHLEGEVMVNVCEIKAGANPYPDALSPRVPPLYTPFFYWIAAPFTDCASPRLFLGARILELGAYVGSLLALALFALGRRPRPTEVALGFVALLGITLSQFGLLGFWYFLARTDLLPLAFAVLSWYALRGAADRPVQLLVAGSLQALAIGTKQSFALMVPFQVVAFVAEAWTKDRPKRAVLNDVVTLGVPTAVMLVGLITGGGRSVWHYVFEVAPRHGLQPIFVRGFWTKDLRMVKVELVMVAALFVGLARRGAYREIVRLACFAAAMIAIAYSSRIHDGGHVNVLIPAMFGIAALGVRALIAASNALAEKPGDLGRRVCVGLATLALIGAGWRRRPWNIAEFKVDPASVDFTLKFVELSRAARVLFSETPQINLMSGRHRGDRAAHQPLWDTFRVAGVGIPDFTREPLPEPVRAIERDLAAGAYDVIISNGVDRTPQFNRESNLFLVDRAVLCASYRFAGEIEYPTPTTMVTPASETGRPYVVFVRGDRARELTEVVARHLPLIPPARSALNAVLPPECLR